MDLFQRGFFYTISVNHLGGSTYSAMTNTRQIRNAIAFALFTAVALLFTTSLAGAQQAEQVNLAISPQRFEISANKGDSSEDVVRLTNGSESVVEIETIPKNFTPVGEEGGVELTEDDTTWSLADWITVSPNTAIIPAGATQDFTITINIPDNAEPGGHFGSVVFKTVPPAGSDAGAAQVSQEIAPVILVKVAGDITETANIESFDATKSFWSNEDVISFETRIGNTGNVHFKPSGSVVIKNMFGNIVTTINLDEQNVLPDSVRKLVTEWNDPGFSVGRYTADLTLIYGADNTILTETTTFTVFPYQTLVPAILLIGLTLFVLVKFRKRVGKAAKVLFGNN